MWVYRRQQPDNETLTERDVQEYSAELGPTPATRTELPVHSGWR